MSVTPRRAPAEVQGSAGWAPARPPRRRSGVLITGAVIGLILGGLALLLLIAYFVLALGPGFTFAGAVLALFPLAVVLLGARWIDRWEPEPPLVLGIGFLWGATVAVLGALIVDAGVQIAVASTGGPTDDTAVLQLVVQAPIVEEILKGFGVLLIFLFARRYFDGPVDGIVYATVVAGGFAFTENIQYFGLELVGSGGFGINVGMVFFLRGILSPFAHAMFTAMTGLAIGIAARRGGRLPGLLAFVIGLIPAIALHALWNGSIFLTDNFFGFYVLVQVPLFIGAIVMVTMLQRRERLLTQQRLAEYAVAGWITPAEVASLGTAAGRRMALAWARPRGLLRTMRSYIRDATRLASTRQRLLTGRDVPSGQADELQLLAKITEARRIVMTPVVPGGAAAGGAAASAPGAAPTRGTLPPPTGVPRP
ncbi:MAG: PrsW family intramembrane metalloprotease [Actinomycetales bacterium]|nr:PrsW family intramembrane metalloprotease [Actinomycetales bacterium]